MNEALQLRIEGIKIRVRPKMTWPNKMEKQVNKIGRNAGDAIGQGDGGMDRKELKWIKLIWKSID